MRQTLSKGMATAAATGFLSLYGTTALADSGANSAVQGAPGVLSGTTVEAPVDVPVNACGNSVDVIAALSPAFGSQCGTDTASPRGREAPSQDRAVRGHEGSPGGRAETPAHRGGNSGGSGAYGERPDSQPPTRLSTTARDLPPTHPDAAAPGMPPVAPPGMSPGRRRETRPAIPPTRPPHQASAPSAGTPSTKPLTLPETGSEGVFAASAGGAALIVGGAMVYRRGQTVPKG